MFEAHALHDGQEEVAEKGSRICGIVAIDGVVGAVFEGTACEKDGEAAIVMGVRIAHSAAVEDGGGIEERLAVHIGFVLQVAEEVTEASDVLGPDAIEFGDLGGVVAVVGEAVVAGAEFFAIDGEDLPLSGDEKGDDAGGIGFQRQGHEIIHQGFTFEREVGGDGIVFGKFEVDCWRWDVEPLALFLDLLFDIANGGEVFLQFFRVAGADGFFQGAGFLEDDIKDTPVAVEDVFHACFVGVRAKEFSEEHAGSADGGKRDPFLGKAHLAFAGGTASELEGIEAGFVSDVAGDDLVEGDTWRAFAGEKVSPVFVSIWGSVIEAGEEREIGAEVVDRLEDGGCFVVVPGLCGEPGGGVEAQVGAYRDEAFHLWRSGGGGGERAESLQDRQGKGQG